MLRVMVESEVQTRLEEGEGAGLVRVRVALEEEGGRAALELDCRPLRTET